MTVKKIIGISIVVILIVGGVIYYLKRDKGSSNQMQTRTVTVRKDKIEQTVEATGEVAPLNRVEIKPPVQGRIEKLLVDEGDHVKTGEVLAWMSSTDRAAIIDAARAKGPDELKRWEDTYKPTPIIAPLAGVVILRNVVVGQTVDLSGVLYAISDKLIVVAHVDEVDIGKVSLKMPARITLDAYPNKPIDGRVFNVLFEGVNQSNVITYGVKVEPFNVPPFFRSQMTANISLIINSREDALLIPAQAVAAAANGEKQVMVPDPEGKPMARTVTTGLESGEDIEIVSGLKEGDSVLIVHKKYVAQKGSASSPLVMGGRPQNSTSGQGGGRSQSR